MESLSSPAVTLWLRSQGSREHTAGKPWRSVAYHSLTRGLLQSTDLPSLRTGEPWADAAIGFTFYDVRRNGQEAWMDFRPGL